MALDPEAMASLLAARDSAGATYAAAVLAFKAAWIELAAVDTILLNDHYRSADSVQTFGNPDDFKLGLQHPVYLKNLSGSWAAEIMTRANSLMNG